MTLRGYIKKLRVSFNGCEKRWHETRKMQKKTPKKQKPQKDAKQKPKKTLLNYTKSDMRNIKSITNLSLYVGTEWLTLWYYSVIHTLKWQLKSYLKQQQ